MTVRHEVEVDTRIAAAYEVYLTANQRSIQAFGSLCSLLIPAAKRASYYGKFAFYDGDDHRIVYANIEMLRERFESGEWGTGYYRTEAPKYFERYEVAFDALQVARDALALVEKEYDGWSRFFLVLNVGGHVHSSMNCSTCNNGKQDTRFAWLPELSGLNEADAVADQGAILCTTCYPSAPVEFTNKYDLDEQAKLDARCPGSGQYVAGNGRRYVNCPVCDSFQSRTPAGNIRAHKSAIEKSKGNEGEEDTGGI